MTGWTMGTEAWIWMAVWALVMVLVVWLLVREPRHETHDDPGAILRARFARGEITRGGVQAGDGRAGRRSADTAADGRPSPRRPPRPHGQEARHD